MPYKDPEKGRINGLARTKRWYEKHKEQARASARARQKKYRAEQPERVRRWQEKGTPKRRAATKVWAKKNAEKIRENNRRRIATQAKTIISLTPAQEAEILEKGCLFCGSHMDLTIAHDTPVSKEGNTTRGNVFCLCRSCNAAMRTKSLKDMIKQLFLL